MATLTLEYNAQNSMARKIVEIILAMDNLFKVKNAVAPNISVERKELATAFLNKWAGKFSVSDTASNDEKYNYLVEKYK